MTDGFPELLGANGEPLGYPRAGEHFAAAAGRDPESVIAHLAAAIDSWRGAARRRHLRGDQGEPDF